jgi:hypothetical protein
VTCATTCDGGANVFPHVAHKGSLAALIAYRAARSSVELMLNALPNQKIAKNKRKRIGSTIAASRISCPASSCVAERNKMVRRFG